METHISQEAFEEFKRQMEEIRRNHAEQIKKILKEVDQEKLQKIREQLGVARYT